MRWPTTALVGMAAVAAILAILDSLNAWGFAEIFRRSGYVAGFFIVALGVYRSHQSSRRLEREGHARRAQAVQDSVSLGFTVAHALRSASALASMVARHRSSALRAVALEMVTQANWLISAAPLHSAYLRVHTPRYGSRELVPRIMASTSEKRLTLTIERDDGRGRHEPHRSELWRLVDAEASYLLISNIGEWRLRDRDVPLGQTSGSMILVPVRILGETTGVIAVIADRPGALVESDRVVLQCVAEALGIAETLANINGNRLVRLNRSNSGVSF